VHAVILVDFDRGRSQKFGELAGGASPEEIHLEKALLGMQESDGTSNVDATLSAKRRDSGGVPIHDDGGFEPFEDHFSLEDREARGEATMRPEKQTSCDEGDGENEAEENPPHRHRGRS
jgi:hypothetical protein